MDQQDSELLINIIENDLIKNEYTNNQNNNYYGLFLDGLGNCFACCCWLPTCGWGCNTINGCCNPYKIVQKGYKGIVTRFGSISGVLDDGLHFVNPITETLTTVDMMLHIKKLAKQSLLTKDKLPISIDGCVYYQVINQPMDIVMSKFGIYDLPLAVDELAHSTLRFVFGQHTLKECLENRQDFAEEMRKILDDHAKSWGISIQDILIIDIQIPKHIQDLLATAATAEQESIAQVIMAKASVQSANMMKEAADLLNSPSAMQMRMLDTYKILAESETAKIIFLPTMDITQSSHLTNNLIANEIYPK